MKMIVSHPSCRVDYLIVEVKTTDWENKDMMEKGLLAFGELAKLAKRQVCLSSRSHEQLIMQPVQGVAACGNGDYLYEFDGPPLDLEGVRQRHVIGIEGMLPNVWDIEI